MPKGRQYVPPVQKDGIWFRHRGGAGVVPEGAWLSSTRKMLTEPFSVEASRRPSPPPQGFRVKEAENYRTTNKFSEHDNRNTLQWHGVYFGNGRDTRHLGKHLVPIDKRLHHTQDDFVKHYSLPPVDRNFSSLYDDSYQGKPTELPPVHRRFPKVYEDPHEGKIKLDTTTTDQFTSPDVPYKTPLHVLAVSQEPFPKHNSWNFSYRPLNRVYPPYDNNMKPVVDNVFNRYGADFQTDSDVVNSSIKC